jgi:subtilisin family serine protease
MGLGAAVPPSAAAAAAVPRPAAEAPTKFVAATRDAVAGSYIVVLAGGAAGATTVNRLTSTHKAAMTHTYDRVFTGFAARMTESDAKAMSEDPAVRYVQQDTAMHTYRNVENPPSWGTDRIDQRHLPLDKRYNYTSWGAGAHAYILDTGIRADHVEFGGRASVAADFMSDGRNGVDCNGHGTHVAGTVGGATYGVANGVSLHAVRVLGCDGSGPVTGIVDGIDWIVANAQRPAVVNMSLGGAASPVVDAAIRSAISSGITFVVAAGNDDRDACLGSPGRVTEAITVASSTKADRRSSFSNTGACVDLFAPGSDIKSAWHTSPAATETISGTSMAAPHVTGAVAKYLGQRPDLTPAAVADLITGNATRGKITNPGTNTPNLLLHSPFGTSHADLNRDGLDDLVTFTRGGQSDVFAATSDGSRFVGEGLRWHDSFASGQSVPLLGDFDGDGRDDAVSFSRGSTGDVFVALSDGNRLNGTGSKWHESFALNADYPVVGDFNGDGRDDIASFTRGTTEDVYVALSTGSSFGPAQLWHENFAAGDAIPAAGDFDGDGDDDIVSFSRGREGNVIVARSTGTSFLGGTRVWHHQFAMNNEIPAVGDFDGDSRTDIVTFTRGSEGDVFVALSTGSSFTGTGVKWHDEFAYRDEVPGVGDVNGDGRDDLVVFNRGVEGDVFVATSTRTGFVGTGVKWHDSFALGTEIPQPSAMLW